MIPEVAVDNSRMTITEFLEARIAEDESAAERCASAFAVPDAVAHTMLNPARMLAECAAKGAIMANMPRNSDLYDARAYISAHTVLSLAAVYKDHPDYRQEWQA